MHKETYIAPPPLSPKTEEANRQRLKDTMAQHLLTTQECKKEIALVHAATQDMTQEEVLKMHALLVKDLDDPTTAGTPFASKTFNAACEAADEAGGLMINRAISKCMDVEEDKDGVDHCWKAPADVRNKHAPLKISLTPGEAWQRSQAGKIKPTIREAAGPQEQPAAWPSWQMVAAAKELQSAASSSKQ